MDELKKGLGNLLSLLRIFEKASSLKVNMLKNGMVGICLEPSMLLHYASLVCCVPQD